MTSGTADRSIVICGLPSSGKTTFLAALWHVINARDIPTKLSFHSLRNGEFTHLNALAARWRNAKVQDHTELASMRLLSMQLKNEAGSPLRITFPDLSGEIYRHIWEDREFPPDILEMLRAQAVLLFVHADTIEAPQWVVDMTAMARRLGIPVQEGQAVPWHPRFAPTQVKIVDLLQSLSWPPLDVGPRRLAVIFSAWDKAIGEGLTPDAFLSQKLPLLDQYLRVNSSLWTFCVRGLSAQGGDYDLEEPGSPMLPEAEALRTLDVPSTRIRLVVDHRESHDITEPLAWLLG